MNSLVLGLDLQLPKFMRSTVETQGILQASPWQFNSWNVRLKARGALCLCV